VTLTFGNVQMVKALTQVLRNLCLHSDDINIMDPSVSRVSKKKSKGMPPPFSSQHQIIAHDLLPSFLTALE